MNSQTEIEKEIAKEEGLKIGDRIMVGVEYYLKTQTVNTGNFGIIIDIDDNERKVLIEDDYGARWILDKWHCVKDTIDTVEIKEDDSQMIIDIKEYIDLIDSDLSNAETDEAREARYTIQAFLSSGDRHERMMNEIMIRRAMSKYMEFYSAEIDECKESMSEEAYEHAMAVLEDKHTAIDACLDEVGIFEILAQDFEEAYGSVYEYTDEEDSTIKTVNVGNLPDCIRDMTKRAEEGKYNEIIGREDEIDTICEVLARKEIRNPLLVGKPGCGKTAVVEEIVKRAYNGEIPYLKDKHFYELRMNDLVAGTAYRGELEKKLQEVMHVLENDKNAVLFIDEIHMIVKAGSTVDDKNDVANALKPYLTSEISIIGATTFDEYRTTIKNDGALARRFCTIMIEEKSKEEVKEIVDKIKGRFENYHNVEISREMIDQIVDAVASKKGDNSIISRTLSAVDTICTKMKVKGINESEAYDKWSTETVFDMNRKNDGGRTGSIGFNTSDKMPVRTNKQIASTHTKVPVPSMNSDKELNSTLEYDNEILLLDVTSEDIKNADTEIVMAIDNIITEMAKDSLAEDIADDVFESQSQESIEM